MNSIRKRLLFSILSVLTLATIAVGIASYLGIRHEMDELYDANMRQLALIASNMAAVKGDTAASSTEWPRGEEIFLIQIWKDGRLNYTSHPAADFPLQTRKGHGRVFFHEKKWSYYQEERDGRIIQVSQELRERRDVIREVYRAIIIPILIQFPLVSLLVWLLVGYGLRPLQRISNLIQGKKAGFLEPIPAGDAPDEIRVLVHALNDLLQRLEISLETQRQFTADAAHELRTPLTAVRLQLDLLQRAATDQDRHEAIATLERGVSRSIHLVQQLLELARQEPEASLNAFSPVDLTEIIHTAVTEQHPMALAKSIDVRAETQPLTVRGDHNALTVMTGNLLNNAIAYTQNGGRVLLRLHAGEGTPTLEISDNGTGIAPEDRARIFDRFYRIMGTDVTGSGLGLSIVKTIVEKHGARITVSGGLDNRGTTFRIIFPAP